MFGVELRISCQVPSLFIGPHGHHAFREYSCKPQADPSDEDASYGPSGFDFVCGVYSR